MNSSDQSTQFSLNQKYFTSTEDTQIAEKYTNHKKVTKSGIQLIIKCRTPLQDYSHY